MKTRRKPAVLLCVLILLALAAPAAARPPGHGHRMHGPHHHGPRMRGHWVRPPRHRRVTERSIYVVSAPVVVAPVAAYAVPVAPVVGADAGVATATPWLPSGYVYHSPDEWRRAYMGDGYRAQPSGGAVVGVGGGVSSFVYHERRYDTFGYGHRHFGPPPPRGWHGPGMRRHHPFGRGPRGRW